MKRLKAQFAEEDVQELQELLKSTKNFRLFRRAQALLEIIHGRSILQTAKLFSYTDSNLRIWIRRFEKDGIFGLLDKPRPGRPKKLTEDVEKILLEILEEDPQKYGALYSQWTTAELARVLQEKTNVSLKETSIRRALKKNGFSFYKPIFNMGGDPEEIEKARQELILLVQKAEKGELILLFEDETVMWRQALPRAG